LVANHYSFSKINPEFIPCSEKEAGERLPAIATVIWTMGAHQKRTNPSPSCRYELRQPVVDLIHNITRDQLARDRRLIRQDNDLSPTARDARDCIESAGKDLEFFPSPNIIGSHPIDNAVAVNKDEGVEHRVLDEHNPFGVAR